MGTITMKHLAKDLGVSVTTISNAYNRPDRLSTELRAKILARGEELGYFGPDAAGRLLRSGKAHAIGVITGSGYSFAFQDPYSVAMMTALSRALEHAGVALSLLPTGPDEEYVDAVASAVVDGIVCMSARSKSKAVEIAVRRGLRVVYGHMVPDGEYVATDDYAAGRLVGEHIRALGHRRVGLVFQYKFLSPTMCGPKDVAKIATDFSDVDGSFWGERIHGMEGGLGPDVQTQFVAPTGNKRESGRVGAAMLLDQSEPPTAIIAVSDRAAMGVLDEVEARGLIPGRDISLTGFDAVPQALQRGITTLRQPIALKGQRTAELILDPDPVERQIILPVELVQGRTTGPAPR